MKNLVQLGSMMSYLPATIKDSIFHIAKDAGQNVDNLELHRHSYSEKAKTNQIDPKARQSLKYVSARSIDRDNEIVIPQAINLDEFMKYKSVLCNHNYSLLPVGSDEWIKADDWGIRALTNHADTGEGTLANVVWALVKDGHLNASSIGFVPTSFTKPGARDWDRVSNSLQKDWAEFDKQKIEKSISRIITGGVLLEHSFVSVPCNTDAELIGVVKSMHLDGKIIKQLGLEDKPAEKVPSVCDECGYVSDAVPGSKCPECKTGDMKAKGKEKAIEIRVVSKGMGSLTADELRQALNKIIFPQTSPGDSVIESGYVSDIYEDHFIYQKKDEMFSQGYAVVGSKPQLVGEPVKVERRTAYVTVVGNENKGFHSLAVEKPNPHMPGGSFSACVLIMEDKGHDSESAKKICGALQAESGEKIYDVIAEEVINKEVKGKAYYTPCVCNECGAEADTNPDEPCEEDGCEGTMMAKKEKKEYTPEITVVKPAPSIKILFAPPSTDAIAEQVGEAVERALSRRTGKIM